MERLNSRIASSQKKIKNLDRVTTFTRKSLEKTSWKDPRACSICQKVLANHKTLKKHVETIHRKLTRRICDLCSKVYFSKQNISSHMKMVHLKKGFVCNVCDYETSSKNHLQRHKMIHADKVECLICKKQVSVLKAHMETHKPKVPCSICHKMVKKLSLHGHIKKAHNKIKCKDCDEVLDSKKSLRRYIIRLLRELRLPFYFSATIMKLAWQKAEGRSYNNDE